MIQVEKFISSILTDDSDKTRKQWAKFIIEEKINLVDFSELLFTDSFIASRFIWTVGDICEMNPETVYPSITYFFDVRYKTKIKNYNRSLAKMFFYCGVPEEIEGLATTEMFDWIIDPKEIVSTKNYALQTLHKLAEKYTELKTELNLVIEDQLKKNPVSFEKTVKKLYRNSYNSKG